jgi:hypothetical protein
VTELRVQIRRTDGTTVWRAKRGALRSLILALSADLFARKMVIHRFGDDAAPLLICARHLQSGRHLTIKGASSSREAIAAMMVHVDTCGVSNRRLLNPSLTTYRDNVPEQRTSSEPESRSSAASSSSVLEPGTKGRRFNRASAANLASCLCVDVYRGLHAAKCHKLPGNVAAILGDQEALVLHDCTQRRPGM